MKLQYVKEVQVTKLEKVDNMLKLGYVRNKRKKPVYNESLMARETLQPRKKKMLVIK